MPPVPLRRSVRPRTIKGMKSLCAPWALALMIPCLTPAAAPDWFPRADMMTIGVYYYPEAWPESQWARDMANMRKLGMEFVHMGDFAWAFMEPEEGKYQFDWLEKNVALAAQNGMKVILCTPTAAPPVWLSRKHPEALMAGGSRETGSRRCIASTQRRSSPNSPSASGTTSACGAGSSTTNSATTRSSTPTRPPPRCGSATGCGRDTAASTG